MREGDVFIKSNLFPTSVIIAFASKKSRASYKIGELRNSLGKKAKQTVWEKVRHGKMRAGSTPRIYRRARDEDTAARRARPLMFCVFK